MKKITFTLLLLCSALTVWSQAAKNVNLLANIPYPHATSDPVGYAASGTEYAIVTHETGTSIYSLATPTNPLLIQEIATPSQSLWHETDIYGHYAYVVTEAPDGLRIVDLSGLPGQCAYKDTLVDGLTTGHTLMVDGDRLYVFGSNLYNGGVAVFSLTDPWRPSLMGGYDANYVHDAYVRNDTAYLGEIYIGLMTMVDMTNPSAPVTLGSVLTPDAFTHNSWLNDAGNICFTTDEVNAAWVAAYDVTNPSNIVEVNRYKSSLSHGLSIPHNVKVLNDFLVIAYYKDGVNIVDASRPHNLIEVGYYDTHPDSGAGFDGNWGLDCYLPSGKILACDMSQGFFVLEPTYVRGCYLEGTVTDASNGNTISGASVTILGTAFGDVTDATGDYATGLADAGTYTVRYAKYGYRDSLVTVTMANGVLNLQNIALYPNPTVSMTVNVVEAGTGNPIPNAKLSFLEVSNQVATDVTADANGQYINASFMGSNYEVIAGSWGHVTNGTIISAYAPTNVITIHLDKGYYDDYAFDFGWTTSGNASSGTWERGEPVGTPFYSVFTNPEFDLPNDHGNACMVTGNGGGASGDDDVDGGTVSMTSPSMDLSGYTNPWLIFDYWFISVSNNGLPGFKDSLKVEIDNGFMTKIVWSKRDLLQPAWVTDTVQIASFLPFTSTTRIKISCGDIVFDQIVEGAIDRVRIEDQNFVATAPAQPTSPLLVAFPNPAGGQQHLRYNLQDRTSGTVRILDMEGRTLQLMDVSATDGQVAVDTKLPAGVYLAVLESGGQRLATQKLIRF